MSSPVRWFGVFAAVICLIVAYPLVIQAAPGEGALIKSRQDKLRDMGGALKAIDDELKKRSPDWENAILPNAQTVQSRSGYLLTWFPKGRDRKSTRLNSSHIT